MSPELSTSAVPEPAKLGQFSRILGVFFEPGKTFSEIAERPRWFVPLLIVCLAALAYFAVYGQHVGWSTLIDQQMANNSMMQQRMEQMSPEQRANTIALQKRIMPVSYYAGALLGIPGAYLISAAILLAITSAMMSAGLRFKQIFAVQCYAALPSVIMRGLAIVVMFLKSPEDFNIMNPLGFNPAAYMDPITSSRFLYTLLTGLDLFTFWTLFLTATGIKAAAGRRVTFGSALFAVMLPWGALLLCGSIIAAIFS